MVFSHRYRLVGLGPRFVAVLLIIPFFEALAPRPSAARPRPLDSATPEVHKLEDSILARINREFRKTKPPLISDPRLRDFARRHAALAAQGQIKSEAIPEKLRASQLGTLGYRFLFAVGADEKEIFQAIQRNKVFSDHLRNDFARAGVGVFYAPAQPPFFQVMMILVKKADPPVKRPGLTTLQTDRVMSAATIEMRDRCYQRVLERDPNFSGQALLELTISGDGTVAKVKLLNKLGDGALDECIQEVARKLAFPKPDKAIPVTLRHPVRFTPPQGKRIVGKLTDGQIRATFARRATEFRSCHKQRQQALGRSELKGRITLTLEVDSAGKVREAGATDNTTFDQALERCVVTHARTLRFPEPTYGGSVEVVFPLDFGG